MRSAPTDHPPEPPDEAALMAFISRSTRETMTEPPPQIALWKQGILDTARASARHAASRPDRERILVAFAPKPLRLAWAALWITAASLHLLTPEPRVNAPLVRRPTEATFRHLARTGQSIQTLSPIVQFHSLKRELQFR